MIMIRNIFISLAMILLSAPLISGQDLIQVPNILARNEFGRTLECK